jgi:Leu/Phe-tRNA-protein transferase
MAQTANSRSIPPISPGLLENDSFLTELVYPQKEINYYWSDCWEPSFYVDLARAGFISVAMDHDQLGSILMPEMQNAYAVLDWKDLHISRKVKKILNRANSQSQDLYLDFASDPEDVLQAIDAQFGQESWLTPAYKELMRTLHRRPDCSCFTLHAVELRYKRKLLAGELGYSCGSVYTSLSGFSSREKKYHNMGKVQMVLLARFLEKRGYTFWNMGHPFMDYKTAMGAKILDREAFLKRWLKDVNNFR